MRLVGLDFETSGTDPWGRSAPIQIGIALGGDAFFESLIGGWNFAKHNGEWEWNEGSFEIHNIPQGTVSTEGQAPRIHEVDVRAAVWGYDHGLKTSNRMWNVMVGWNVAGFDGQFVSRHFPNLRKLLSYRTIDLGALVLSLSHQSPSEYRRIKSEAKDFAVDQMGGEKEWHNALYDARAALFSYRYLEGLILRRSDGSEVLSGKP